MTLDKILTVLSRRPAWVITAWLALAAAVGLGSPNLTRLAAEGQSKLLGQASESRRAAELVRQAWPDQAYESTAVLALYRPAGLTEPDRRFAVDVVHRFEAADRPRDILRILGPTARPEIADRLVSQDKTLSLLVVPLDSSHVSPTAHKAIDWMQSKAEELRRQTPPVAGLELRWTGDSVIGRDYMGQVQASLDRGCRHGGVVADRPAAGLPIGLAGVGAIGHHRHQPDHRSRLAGLAEHCRLGDFFAG